jgi:hypothetical protein
LQKPLGHLFVYFLCTRALPFSFNKIITHQKKKKKKEQHHRELNGEEQFAEPTEPN